MMRWGAGLCGMLALAACTALAPSKSVTLAEGEIVAVPPSGYCVDNVSSQPRRDFAVFVPCVMLDVGEDTQIRSPDVVGVATVQVGPENSGAIAQDEIALRDFLITNAGASLLSQSGNANDITILSTQTFSDQVMVHFADRGAPPFAGLQREEWRAFRNINGRLLTIGVRGLSVAPLRDGPGAGLLKLILAGIQSTLETEDLDAPDDA
jgi:hypothetical protein